ncbi:MAG: hypothetical protein K8S99_13635 [Planctomycetes bacterium]|nr:hypothetical protein [Planctomycetota bacterium]
MERTATRPAPRSRPTAPGDGARSRRVRKPVRARGLSLVETLIALSITALLLTATMVATDASFRAYADAAEQASAQSSTRMVVNRLLTLIRTSTAHGPLTADTSVTPNATLSGQIVTSPYIELIDATGNLVRVEYHPATKELWVKNTPAGSTTATSQPILGGVTAASFFCLRRMNDDGLWVLDRGTMDLTITPGADATLAIEAGKTSVIRVITSTMPRKID